MAICYCKDCKNAFVSHTESDTAKCPKCESECRALSENDIKEQRDAIYLSAMHKKQIALYPRDLEEAKNLFVALGKYRDCEAQTESCEYLAARMTEREIAEEKSASFSPERIKKAFKITAAVVVIIALLSASLLLLISPMKYASAKKRFDKGDYEKASEIFSEIADYKDSKEYLEKIYEAFTEKEGKKVSCSALEPYFSLSGDGGIVFTRSKYQGDGSIVIPAIFDGVTVTEIENNSFKNYAKLKSVSIPDGIVKIGDYSFYGCTGITEINLPDSVSSIGQYAFMGCTSLERINIPSGASEISAYSFASCASLSFPTLPDSITKIDASAFIGCASFEKVILPKNVTSIGVHAFDGCANMTEITLSVNVTEIGDNAFSSCERLESVIYMGSAEDFEKIEIEDGNESFTSAKVTHSAK